MANRFNTPSEQFVDSAGTPYSGGKLYFYVTGTSTPLDTYSDPSLTVPFANTNPVTLDSAGRAGDIFLQNLAYKVVLKDASLNQIWTADPVSTSDYTTVASVQVYAGSPTGFVAGTAGSGSIPSSMVWDNVNNILYICTTTGNAATAVWTAVNASSAAAVVPTPQGYLTPTSSTPVITGNSLAATSVFYTPYVGNLVPIYNGASFVPTTFAELTMTLTSSQALSTIYDLFVFSNSGVVTIAVGPAWTTSTSNAGARGTGAGTTQLQRISGIWVNAVSMTARNSSTTYTVAANQGTYVGSVHIDGTAGQVSCHRTYGQSRKWGVWNAYNRRHIYLKAGDGTASWGYTTNTTRSSNGSAANSLQVFSGLAEEVYDLRFNQLTGNAGSSSAQIGIGFSSTTAFSGHAPAPAIGGGNANQLGQTASYWAVPTLGMVTISALENGKGAGGTTFYGTETSMLLTANYFG